MARLPDEEPTFFVNRESSKTAMGEGHFTHPAFGQIRAGRISGNQVLYGSDFLHHNYIAVTIKRSQLNRSLSRDWHFGREELIEVMLSEAQWATFVSSMNIGDGVPCTINHLAGKGVPGIPYRTADHEFKNEVRERVQRSVASVRQTMEAIAGLGLSKAKTQAIQGALSSVIMNLESNLPFVADQFDKHVEDKIEKAKVEANAYIVAAVTRAGLEALANPVLSTPMLEED